MEKPKPETMPEDLITVFRLKRLAKLLRVLMPRPVRTIQKHDGINLEGIGDAGEQFGGRQTPDHSGGIEDQRRRPGRLLGDPEQAMRRSQQGQPESRGIQGAQGLDVRPAKRLIFTPAAAERAGNAEKGRAGIQREQLAAFDGAIQQRCQGGSRRRLSRAHFAPEEDAPAAVQEPRQPSGRVARDLRRFRRSPSR